MLPRDPNILLSLVNMKLRDLYPSLDALCDDLDENKTDLLVRLEAAGWVYDAAANTFRRA